MPPGLSSSMTMKRIHREIADLKKEDLGPMVLAPLEDNLYIWKGSIPGPEGSAYEGGLFNVEVHLAPDYPFSAPRVIFKTRIYHMNISDQGNICIDILKHNWSPALSLFKVMLSLSSLLTDPNPQDPLVPSIATQYTRNRKLHDNTARQWTELYARPPKPKPAPAPAPHSASPSSSKVKGKKKAETMALAAGGSSSRPPQTSESVIVLSDSEGEDVGNTSARMKRKRGPARAADSGEVIDVSDDEADVTEGHSTRTTTRKKPRTSGAAGSSTRCSTQLEEVIVIEDD